MIFTSYRRADSAAFAGRIVDFLETRYKDIPVFLDVASIDPGEDFKEAIARKLGTSKVVLMIIGDRWLERDAHGKRRIDDPNDLVRHELETALSLKLRIIPVLLDDATMPSIDDLPGDLKPLAMRNAEHIRGTAFSRDVEHLGAFVIKYLKQLEPLKKPQHLLPEGEQSVRAELVKAFAGFRDFPEENAFLICETPSEHFVQFAKAGGGQVQFDLPSEGLTAQEMINAQQLFAETYRSHVDQRGDQFSLKLTLPLEPIFLSYFSMSVFESVFKITPCGPLKITIDTFS